MGGWLDLQEDTFQSAVLVGTQIWSGVSWFQWQSVEAVWNRFREAGIRVGRAKTVILEPQGAVPSSV